MHFDVFLPVGCGAHCDEKAADYARTWLHSIGMKSGKIKLEQCRYCHSQAVTPEIRTQLEQQGYFILQMEGRPSPIS